MSVAVGRTVLIVTEIALFSSRFILFIKQLMISDFDFVLLSSIVCDMRFNFFALPYLGALVDHFDFFRDIKTVLSTAIIANNSATQSSQAI